MNEKKDKLKESKNMLFRLLISSAIYYAWSNYGDIIQEKIGLKNKPKFFQVYFIHILITLNIIGIIINLWK